MKKTSNQLDICRKPAIKSFLFGFIFAVAAIATGCVVYFKRFEPITIFSPE